MSLKQEARTAWVFPGQEVFKRLGWTNPYGKRREGVPFYLEAHKVALTDRNKHLGEELELFAHNATVLSVLQTEKPEYFGRTPEIITGRGDGYLSALWAAGAFDYPTGAKIAHELARARDGGPKRLPADDQRVEVFSSYLNGVEIKDCDIRAIGGSTGLPVSRAAEVRLSLVDMLTNPEDWRNVEEYLIRDHIDSTISIGGEAPNFVKYAIATGIFALGTIAAYKLARRRLSTKTKSD